MQERMESEPSTLWQRKIDEAALCHTTKQQMEDGADSQKQVREEEFARAKKLVLTDQAGLRERSGGGQPPRYVTNQHNLHVQELIIREEHSLQVEESVLELRLEDGPKFEQAKAKGNIKRNVNLKGMQSADSAGQETLTTELESFLADSKDQFKKSSVVVDEECFLDKLEGRLERLENEFSKMLQKNQLKKSLEEEQQPGARVEEELSQTKTLCTEMEETINELVQVFLTSQPNNDAHMLKEPERNDSENLLSLKEMLGVEQEARAKTEADKFIELRKAYTDLQERFDSLEQVCEALMEAKVYLNNLREKELREEQTLVTELLESLDEMQHAKLSLEKELSYAKQRSVMLEQQIESERYVSAPRERNFQVEDWIIQREEIVLSEEILGVGSWGTVRMGTFRGCQVAVKQVHEVLLSDHNRALFAQEMRILCTCHHPNLLQFIGATFDDGTPLFVTELLDTSLRRVLRERPLPLKDTATIALDVAKGLNYLHLKPSPILHRDVSSANVLLWRRDESWRAKLGDFGAATLMRSCMSVAPGSLMYSAPETLTTEQTTKVKSLPTRFTYQLNARNREERA